MDRATYKGAVKEVVKLLERASDEALEGQTDIKFGLDERWI